MACIYLGSILRHRCNWVQCIVVRKFKLPMQFKDSK